MITVLISMIYLALGIVILLKNTEIVKFASNYFKGNDLLKKTLLMAGLFIIGFLLMARGTFQIIEFVMRHKR